MLERVMRKKIIVLVCCFSQATLFAQNGVVDSLLHVLHSSKEDKVKVITLNQLSSHSLVRPGVNFPLAKKYAEDALAIAKKIDFKQGIADSYNGIGYVYYNLGDYAGALENYSAFYKTAVEMDDKQRMADYYFRIGSIYSRQGNVSEALNAWLVGLKIREQAGDKRKIAEAYMVIGQLLIFQQSAYEEVLKYAGIALKIWEEIGDKSKIAESHNRIGTFYRVQGNYSEAIKSHSNAIKTFNEIGDKPGMAVSCELLATVFRQQGNYSEALKNYRSSGKIHEALGNRRGVADNFRNVGSLFRQQAEMIKSPDSAEIRLQLFAQALKNYSSSIDVYREFGDRLGVSDAYADIAEVHRLQKNFPEALNNHLASLKIKQESGNKSMVAGADLYIGKLNIEAKNFSEAKRFLNDGLSLYKEIKSKQGMRDSYHWLAILDSAACNWGESFQNHKLFITYRDSLVNEENSKKIVQAQLQYLFNKKEDSLRHQQALTDEKLKEQSLVAGQQRQSILLKENEVTLLINEKRIQYLQLQKNESDYALQKAEAGKKQNQVSLLNKEKDIQTLQIKKQKLLKNYLLLGLGAFIILAFFVYYNYRTGQQLRLQKLRNKIASDLHDDVGSTLSSISIFSQLAQQQSKEVIPMLETIGESSRRMLDAMADIVWTINPENDQFEKIVSRMKNFAYELLGAKNIDFEFIAGDDVSTINVSMEVRKNLYLIFKEATNNMVKYAQANKALFVIKGEENHLMMMIRDNGKGFDVTKSREGNGLKNMKKRASEIGAQLVIDSFPGNGTTIQLNVAV